MERGAARVRLHNRPAAPPHPHPHRHPHPPPRPPLRHHKKLAAFLRALPQKSPLRLYNRTMGLVWTSFISPSGRSRPSRWLTIKNARRRGGPPRVRRECGARTAVWEGARRGAGPAAAAIWCLLNAAIGPVSGGGARPSSVPVVLLRLWRPVALTGGVLRLERRRRERG